MLEEKLRNDAAKFEAFLVSIAKMKIRRMSAQRLFHQTHQESLYLIHYTAKHLEHSLDLSNLISILTNQISRTPDSMQGPVITCSPDHRTLL